MIRVPGSILPRGVLFFIVLNSINVGCSEFSVSDKISLENEFNERQSKNLVAYMSLETMFPDEEAQKLAKAIKRDDVKRIDSLIANGIDVNFAGTQNASFFFFAMREGSLDGFNSLLDNGADPNVVHDDGGAVMHWAVRQENENFLVSLLDYSGNPNLAAGTNLETPIFEAIAPEGKNKFDLLVQAGSDVNFKQKEGYTPVLKAAMLNQYDIVYKLIKLGADVTVEANNGINLSRIVNDSKRTMILDHELTHWLNKVIKLL